MSFCSFSKGEIYRNHFEPGKNVNQRSRNMCSQGNITLSFYLSISVQLRIFLDSGKYVCKECGHELFRSEAKYEHQTPWPAFTKTVLPDSVAKVEERKGALKVKDLSNK